MDSWHRNVRLLHQIDEFLDVDSTQRHFVADFIALIDAVREGLHEVDDHLRIPDSQINLHFLTKLKSRPDWKDWAMDMLRDSRVNSPNPSETLSFRELADMALKQERKLLKEKKVRQRSGSKGKRDSASSEEPETPRMLTQDEINAFVVQEMRNQRASRRLSQISTRNPKSHYKRPSQEEINEYVIRQMRKDQEKKARSRSHSPPEKKSQPQPHYKPTSKRCNFCGDLYHPSTNCWRRWRVAAEALQGNAAPKMVDARSGLLAEPRIYLSGVSPF